MKATVSNRLLVKQPPRHNTYPLKNLLPSNILQPSIQILNLLHNILNLPLIRTLNIARLPNRKVESKFDPALVAPEPRPALGGRALRREADLVLARVGRGEGEAALARTPLRHDLVVVVEDLFDGDVDFEVRVLLVGVGRFVEFFGGVVA